MLPDPLSHLAVALRLLTHLTLMHHGTFGSPHSSTQQHYYLEMEMRGWSQHSTQAVRIIWVFLQVLIKSTECLQNCVLFIINRLIFQHPWYNPVDPHSYSDIYLSLGPVSFALHMITCSMFPFLLLALVFSPFKLVLAHILPPAIMHSACYAFCVCLGLTNIRADKWQCHNWTECHNTH